MPPSPESAPSSALADARWFPVDLHVPERRFTFATLDVDALERSTFLDTRLDAGLDDATPVGADAAASVAAPPRPPAWLFHTSFCGSTLLARALHVPPHQVALKEPLVLRRLGDARHAGWSTGELSATTARLLSRPWSDGGGVLIKATHAALNIAGELLDATPGSRAVLLTSSLEDFLISNLKKPADTWAKVPELAERALRAGSLHTRLPAQALQPPDLLCAVALQWAAQRDLIARLAAQYGDRARLLDFTTLAADPVGVPVACSRWWRLPAPAEVVRARADEVARRNAKAVSVEYSADRRAHEARLVHDHHRGELARARAWAERFVMPALHDERAMTPPEEWT
ncbi:hypothetical protein JI752_010910 [Lysobacter sp. MMG2]|uniref:hypothetical protein n=1 Tax=Lysobacter sp. MMG2 TaxID=2801338 RepID=UPI001C2440FD|nr:hypothetical protein [Lysobacter sp. MMG2]MBU8976650.1 hypothetical protein [Lysobacter sp. MMG2]